MTGEDDEDKQNIKKKTRNGLKLRQERQKLVRQSKEDVCDIKQEKATKKREMRK